MAESIVLSPIVEILLVTLWSLDEKKVLLQPGVVHELKKLKKTLSSIRGVLFNAENQQSHNDGVREWLKELKDACCDAEKVLEELEVEVLRRQSKVDQSRSITRKVCDFVSFEKSPDLRFTKSNNQIKEIREKLHVTKDRICEFDFKNRNVHGDREMTLSFVDDFDNVFEREIVKENIVRTLPQSHDVKFGIFAIVGDSGIGKTKLAKRVYNDQRVEAYFDVKMWACCPNKFVEKKIMIDMIHSVTGHIESNMEIDQLKEILHDILKGKRYLLVLDDVLTKDKKKWNDFIRLLSVGAKQSSRIIVITSSNEVASMVDAWRMLSVKWLSYKSILSLFMTHAFENGKEKNPNLTKIGEEIAEKCSGHPLVAKILASTLYFSTDEDDWKYVKDNIEYEDGKWNTSSALKLSYDLLPPHLKQCFVYCSIFPKEYEFNNIVLTEFWMANGLLQYEDGENEELEVTGMRYINELRRRCFFQDFEQKFDFIYFKMHGLIHDLATTIAEKEWRLILEEDRNKLMRSILFHGMTPSQSIVRVSIFKAPNLEALDLRNSDIELLPESIGKLKNLKYLNLTKSIKLKRLPQSLYMLTSLETLLLGGCKGLEVLPRSIRRLVNLRILVFSSKQTSLAKNEIGCLSSLRCLGIGSCYNLEHLFEDIDHLELLQTLIIGNCPKLVSLPTGVKNLSSLEKLMIYSRKKHGYCKLNMEIECSGQELQSLKPHLQMLCIDGLPEFQGLPRWLRQSSANTLQYLAIKNCPKFERLTTESPQILKSLEVLEFSSCPKLSSLVEDLEFLTALKELKIQDCPDLSRRCKYRGEDWPKISRINKIEIDGKLQGRDAFPVPGDINGGGSDNLIWAGFDVASYARFKTERQIGSP